MSDTDMAELQARTERMQAIIEDLPEDLPVLTRLIMAGDIDAANRAEVRLRAGDITWAEALFWCGSYSRVDAALRWQEAGFATRDELLDKWPHLWSGGDPDDSDPRFLVVWHEARVRNGGTVTDGEALPDGERLTIYRGQRPLDSLGIAWSLKQAVAMKFANGASMRTPIAGQVYVHEVHRSTILGYMTARGEAEVIVDPQGILFP